MPRLHTQYRDHMIDQRADVPGRRHEARRPVTHDLAAAAEFALEGLYARKQIARSEERGYSAVEQDMSEEGGRRRWN